MKPYAILSFFVIFIIGCGGKPTNNDSSAGNNEILKSNFGEKYFSPTQILEHQSCSEDNQLHYACYIPANYKSGEKYPVLLLFDPHGDPLVPINKYKQLCDEYNYIIVSSYDSKNGNNKELTGHIIQVMAETIYNQMPIDSNRFYVGGFSGGARVASLMAFSPVGAQGLVTCGAGFPMEAWTNYPPSVICAIALDSDMNLPEVTRMKPVDPAKEGRFFPIRYKGIHEWPSAKIFREVFITFEAVAMRDELFPLSKNKIDQLNNDYEKVQTENGYYENLIWMVSYFERRIKSMGPFVNMDTLKFSYSKMLASNSYQSQLQKEKKIIQEEEQIKQNFYSAMGKQDTIWWNNQMRNLNQEIQSTNDLLKQSQLQRIKAALSLACYMNLDKAIQSNARDAYTYLSTLYRAIDPENSEAWFLSVLVALKENKNKEALSYLQQAIKTGFSDKERLNSNVEFTKLSSEPLFNELLNKMKN